MKLHFSHISCESIAAPAADLTQDKIRETVENILKSMLNLPAVDDTKSFADLGMTPDQFHEMIMQINTALNLTLDPNVNVPAPIDLIKLITSQTTQPLLNEDFSPAVFDGYIKEIAALQKDLEAMTDSSQESLGTMLTKALASAGDIFLRVGNSFKTSVLRMGHSVKRSEIKAYYESNMLKVNKVEGSPFALFEDMDADIPAGMKGTFINAVKGITDAYMALDFYTFIAAVEKHLKDMRQMVARDSTSFSQLNTILTVIKTREKLLVDQKALIGKIFTQEPSDTGTANFDAVYASMAEFKQVREDLIGLMSRIDESTRLSDCVDECDMALQDIISLVEQDTQIDKNLISNLLEITKYMSAACSFYGENVSRQLALEHNHVCNIARCWQALR